MAAGVDSLNVGAAAAVAFYALRPPARSEPAVARLGDAVGAEADQAEPRRARAGPGRTALRPRLCSATSKPSALPGWWSIAALTTKHADQAEDERRGDVADLAEPAHGRERACRSCAPVSRCFSKSVFSPRSVRPTRDAR